jgi:hypothetical protein
MPVNRGLPILIALLARLFAVGGGGAVVAYGIFQWLGKTWLAQHFNRQLEQFKADQQKELERVRHEINALFSRISKIHEKEFQVLPTAWQLLHKANGAVLHVVQAVKRFPDFTQIPEADFERFLEMCPLLDFQKNELRLAKDRQKFYEESIFWVELNEAKRAQAALNNYLALNSIFMTKGLQQQFKGINDAFRNILIDEEVSHSQGHNAELLKSISDNLSLISDALSKIESAVQQRLRYEEA